MLGRKEEMLGDREAGAGTGACFVYYVCVCNVVIVKTMQFINGINEKFIKYSFARNRQ